MTLILVTPPDALPLSVAELKLHAHIDHDEEDERIQSFIEASIGRVDGRDGSLGVCLITQVWKLSLDCFASEITLPLPPCQSVDAITYVDNNGATQTLNAAEYQVAGIASMDGARIVPAYGLSWPATRSIAEAVSITFTAGFGATADDMPEALRTGIAMRAAYLYANRENVTTADGFFKELPDSADDFARNYRQFHF